MRIATSTIYSQQTAAIDDQNALYLQIGQQLSSGKKLQAPSDDPTQIAHDLQIHTAIDSVNQQSTNVQNAVSELTTTDGALNSLVSVLQSARTLGIQGATETLTDAQRTSLGNQIDELLQQSIAIGNTKYADKYVFGGTASNANAPVQQTGTPISAVTFTGNEQVQGQLVYNSQQFALSTTFQAAFNYGASNNSPDVFQTLIRLRDTLVDKVSTDQSSAPVNQAGQTVYGPQIGGIGPAPTTLAQTASFATAPVPGAGPPAAYTITINGAPNGGTPSVQTITIAANAPIDDGGASGTSVISQINAVSATTGVTASYDAKTQRVSLTGTGAFYVNDASGGGNLTQVLHLASQSDFVQNLSTQLGDIDNVLNTALNARSVVGARIQALTSISSQLQTTVTDNKSTESQIEDVDVAAATSKFSQTQVALQAAYATTTRLESKTLFDYLT